MESLAHACTNDRKEVIIEQIILCESQERVMSYNV